MAGSARPVLTLPLLGLALAFPYVAEARPVSYPGGWTVMQHNNGGFSSLHVHHSPTVKQSIGLYAEENWETEFTFVGAQYNQLVKRWNAPKSQANLYLKLGAGGAESYSDSDVEVSGFAGIAADWETRRWFVSYEGRALDMAGDQFARHGARLGVAPYIGDYGDLHTWLMLQVEDQPEQDEPVTTTPLVRFFYGVQLLELGYTVETERLMLNWIVRY